MKVTWIRSMGGGISFRRPSTFLSFGIRGSGKSSLLEHIGENYLSNGFPIIDLFGSRDGEGLGWCRSPWAKDKKILLLHGDNTRVASSFDSMNISKWQLSDLEKYDITISSSPLYSSPDQEYRDVNRIIDLTYQRRVFDINSQITYILIREASNLLYSRMKVSTDQVQAKSKMTYFIREARHTGFALGIDTLKFTSIDIDIRSVIDYIFFKSLGIQGLPDDLSWLYSLIKPFALQSQEKKRFVCINSAGSVGIGTFSEVPWHKKEGEDILKECGIEVEHGEEMIESKKQERIGDLEHAKFIERRLNGEGYADIGGTMWTGEAIRIHVRNHNHDIDLKGACPRCTRAKSTLNTTKIPTGRYKGE